VGKTNSQRSFAGKIPGKKSLIIAVVILAITIGHFVTQISFIESENKRIVESLAKSELVIETDKTETAETRSPAIIPESGDQLLITKPGVREKNVEPVKVVQKESRPQPEVKPLQNNLKKETKGESKTERLRRAEKLLTGF
jgi:hypothetical protein